MRGLEDMMNRLTDMNAGWWPLLHLRPARAELMDNRRLAKIAVHFGSLFGLLIYGWYVLVEFMPLSASWALFCVATSVVFFFLGYKYTFAVFWNRRAERLRSGGVGGAI